MKKNPVLLFLLILSLAAAACNIGAPAPQDSSALATSAAQTVEAVLTKPAASPTAQTSANASSTPVPGVAIDGTTAEPAECQNSYLITRWERDGVTYDKVQTEKPLAPGSSFVMTWELQNNGTCVWDDTYTMRYESGERLSTQDKFPVMPKGYRVQPGESLTINLQLIAPSKPGTFNSTYQLEDAQGNYVLIAGLITTVGTPSTGKLPAPGDLRYEYDCSGGITRISLFWKDKADNEEGFRVYRDGEKITDLPANATVYDDIAPAPGSYLYTVAAFNPSGEAPTNVQVETSACQ